MEPNNPILPTVRLAGPVILLSSAWSLFKAHWKVLVSITVIPAICTLIAQISIIIGGSLLAIISVVLIFISMILSMAMQGALVSTIQKLATNSSEIIGIKEQYKFGFSLFWSFVFVGLLQALVFIGASILFIIPGIIVVIYVSMYSFALFIEGKRGFVALTESYSLIKGRWWGVFGRSLFIGLVSMILYFILVGILLIITLVFGSGSESVVSNIISTILSTTLSVILGAFLTVYMYRLYESLKATRSENVSTIAFGRWLKSFVGIGIIVIVLFIGLGIWVVSSQGLSNLLVR